MPPELVKPALVRDQGVVQGHAEKVGRRLPPFRQQEGPTKLKCEERQGQGPKRYLRTALTAKERQLRLGRLLPPARQAKVEQCQLHLILELT